MTITMNETAAHGFDARQLAAALPAVIGAGALATIAFDAFGQGLSPMAGFAKLAPVGLADGTIKAVLGTKVTGGADLLHFATGLIAYPLGWFAVARPLWQRVMPSLSEWAAAAAYGVVLSAFALFVMAHLVVGLPAFLGFTGITWVALAGHVVYALALVGGWRLLSRR